MNDNENSKQKVSDIEEISTTKIPYQAPQIKSEKLLGFGAVCNGTTNGGRKDTTGAPNFCNASRLMS
jgi:hypothetical protein